VNGSCTLELLEIEAISTTLSWELKAKVCKNVLSQSHGFFLQRLVKKCTQRGVTLETPSESHTSKNAAATGCSPTSGVPKRSYTVLDTRMTGI